MTAYQAYNEAMSIMNETWPKMPIPTPEYAAELIFTGKSLLHAGFDSDVIRQFYRQNLAEVEN